MFLIRSFICLVFIGILSIGNGHAQEVWDLEKCILHAQDQSLDVKQQLINKAHADLSYRQAKHSSTRRNLPPVTTLPGYASLLPIAWPVVGRLDQSGSKLLRGCWARDVGVWSRAR